MEGEGNIMLMGLLVAFFIGGISIGIAFLILHLTEPKVDSSAALQQKILEDLAIQLKEFQRIPALLTNPAGLKQIGEKNLEFLLTEVLPKDFVLFQHEMPGVGVVDTALKIGERILPIDSKFPKLNSDKKLQASAVRDRIREASKYISPKHGTTDFCLMYVHSELIYAQSFIENNELLSFAMENNVIPVSPSTIYVYLSTLMDVLKRVDFNKNEGNVLQNIKQTIGIFEATKLSSDKSIKQLRDALTNAEMVSKKTQDAIDVLSNLTGDEK